MKGTIQATRDNVKSAYSTTNGEFYVHGVTIDGLDYESHQKGKSNKWKVGQIIEYDLKADAKGNQKIANVKVIEGSISGQTQQTALPQPVVVASSDTAIWLDLFRSLSLFRQNDNTLKTNDLAEAADQLLKRVPR